MAVIIIAAASRQVVMNALVIFLAAVYLVLTKGCLVMVYARRTLTGLCAARFVKGGELLAYHRHVG